MDLLTFITSGLLHDPVFHEGDWEGVRPWLRPFLTGRGPDGVDDRTAVEEAGEEKYFSPLMTGVLLFARVSNANHMASKVPNGDDTVAKPPGYSVGIKMGHCSLTIIGTTSKTTSTPGPKTRSVPVDADSTPRNARRKSKKGVPLDSPKLLGVAAPHVGAVDVVAQQPQEECKRLRSRGSACEGT